MAIATYTLHYPSTNIFNVTVPYDGTATFNGEISATFSPASGLSSVQFRYGQISGANNFFYATGIETDAIYTTDGWIGDITLINDGAGTSQVLQLCSVQYINTNNASQIILNDLGFEFALYVPQLSAGSTDTIDPNVSAADGEFYVTGTIGGSLTAEGGNITYDTTPTLNLNQSVAYGTSGTYTGTLTFTSSSNEGPNTSVSAVNLNVYLSGADVSRFTSISSSVTLPGTVIVGDSINIATTFNNDYLHADNQTFTLVTVASTSGPVLSASWAGTYTPTTTNFETASMTLTATGDSGAPSAIGSFTANAGQLAVELSWTNPTVSDLSAVMVRWAFGPEAPTAYTAGTNLYSGTGTSTQHTGLTAASEYVYSIFALDNVGNWSVLTASTSATATPYAENNYGVSWGTYLTNAQIRQRLSEEGII